MKRGFKQTEIGEIPEDWEVVTLGSFVADLQAGVSVNSKEEDAQNQASGPFILKTSAVQNGSLKLDERKTIATKDLARARRNLRGGSILISRMNTPELVGECAYVQQDVADTFLPDRVWGTEFHNDAPICGLWLSQLLSSPPVKIRIRNLATGTSGSMKNIAKSAILGLLLPCPTLQEQQVISAALSDMDGAIEGLSRLIAKKRDLWQGAMQSLLSGETRLPKFAENWRFVRLGDCLKNQPRYGINAAAVPHSDDLPTYIRITDISDEGKFSPSPLASVVSGEDKYRVRCGDVLFARTGASVGKTYLYNPSDGDLIFAGFLINISTDKSILIPEFLFFLTKTQLYWDWVKQISMRSGQPGINGQEYSQLKIKIPTISEQTAIARVLSEMDAEISALEARLAKMRAIKQGMMQDLLTGRVRLPLPSESLAQEDAHGSAPA